MSQLRRKVEFKTNVPVQVALAYDDGILKQDGRFGDYWIYTLEDERVMFVPPAVHDQIERLHITRGQRFTVTKQEKRVGNRRAVDWLVDFPEEATETNPPSPSTSCSPRSEPPALQPSLLAEDLQKPMPITATAEGVRSKVNSAAPTDDGGTHTAASANSGSNGAVKPNGTPSKSAAPDNGSRSNTSPLFRASMRAAIDALIDAEQYAATRNYSVRFTNEDLRATAISIFIAVRDRSSR